MLGQQGELERMAAQVTTLQDVLSALRPWLGCQLDIDIVCSTVCPKSQPTQVSEEMGPRYSRYIPNI